MEQKNTKANCTVDSKMREYGFVRAGALGGRFVGSGLGLCRYFWNISEACQNGPARELRYVLCRSSLFSPEMHSDRLLRI